MGLTSFFHIKKVPVGIYPLLGIIGFAVGGASYFAYHSLSGPEILLRKGEAPNMSLKSNETTKFYRPTEGHFVHWKRQF
ncbi:hypothetical protein BC833DRAFT_523818 [Globomyces pollinis-pini]|nr:hypothetical protein BC833DRAFT_523818 [Globomyces pollinis-pini]